jgi:hypothetical protein
VNAGQLCKLPGYAAPQHAPKKRITAGNSLKNNHIKPAVRKQQPKQSPDRNSAATRLYFRKKLKKLPAEKPSRFLGQFTQERHPSRNSAVSYPYGDSEACNRDGGKSTGATGGHGRANPEADPRWTDLEGYGHMDCEPYPAIAGAKNTQTQDYTQ